MEFNLQQAIALLSRTPATLNALLRDLPEVWTLRNEGENTWSAFEIVAHLIYGERADWVPRARIILQFGESALGEPRPTRFLESPASGSRPPWPSPRLRTRHSLAAPGDLDRS